MKFAKELEQQQVAEWSAKYLNYKLGKKKLKAVRRAYRNLHRTPKTPFLRNGLFNTSPWEEGGNFGSNYDQLDPKPSKNGAKGYITTQGEGVAPDEGQPFLFAEHQFDRLAREERLTRYGSIICSRGNSPSRPAKKPPLLILPDPALTPRDDVTEAGQKSSKKLSPEDIGESAYEAAGETPSRLRRLLSIGGNTPSTQATDVPLEAYHELEQKQAEFFEYLDSELDKIETFYEEKEDEATERLKTLRQQLHILRDRRIDELAKAQTERKNSKRASGNSESASASDEDPKTVKNHSWLSAVDHTIDLALHGRFGKQSKAMEHLTSPRIFRGRDDNRDYERRATGPNVPYRTAKRKLKLAVTEFYRSLELLKSYALLNRTAFQKITKKYDKTVNSRPTGRYMSEKIKIAWFVKSDVLDGHIQAVEDLYARYFEGGNHKVAAGKLRAMTRKQGEFGDSMFRNGCFLTAGAIFGTRGLEQGVKLLFSDDPTLTTNTSFLLQLYAGYALLLITLFFFCLACEFWSYSKVNYVFIFEFDTRHHLDWRQLLEFPSFFFFLMGFFMWINFTRYGSHEMYTYFPTILIGITVLIMFLPFEILYHRTRFWFLYTNWRLLFSGLYPVEFRDFFSGDLFCSHTYAMGNIELFFCLYARNWNDPAACKSSHSRLLGFFTTLPGIWRAIQCLRRYRDTQNVFPHLVNCGKYSWTIIYYMSLSLYRINTTPGLRAFFIASASINAVYCSIWDIVMDWSLLDPTSSHPFLRDTLAYKQIWLYYLAIVIDPILRFNWIFYAIYAEDIQHSAFISFAVALSEVCRRGLWVLFRVENEHCTNVGRFRASRDMPLPFDIKDSPAMMESGLAATTTTSATGAPIATATSAGSAAGGSALLTSGAQSTRTTPSLRRRKIEASPLIKSLTRVGSIMHTAHMQDFEKRLVRDLVDSSDEDEAEVVDSEDEDQHEDRPARKKKKKNSTNGKAREED